MDATGSPGPGTRAYLQHYGIDFVSREFVTGESVGGQLTQHRVGWHEVDGERVAMHLIEPYDAVGTAFILHGYFDHLKATYFAGLPAFAAISMGMSGDYALAVAEGSTLVRVGSAIFGSRG